MALSKTPAERKPQKLDEGKSLCDKDLQGLPSLTTGETGEFRDRRRRFFQIFQ